MSVPRKNVAAAIYENQLFAIGGSTAAGGSNMVECYNEQKDEWTQMEPLIEAKSNCGIAVMVHYNLSSLHQTLYIDNETRLTYATPYYTSAASLYTPAAPSYSPASLHYTPPAPSYFPVSAYYASTPPSYTSASPLYAPTPPSYSSTSPLYAPTSAVYIPNSPGYSPTNPSYSPT